MGKGNDDELPRDGYGMGWKMEGRDELFCSQVQVMAMMMARLIVPLGEYNDGDI